MRCLLRVKGPELSDLRSQLIAKLGVSPPVASASEQLPAKPNPLSDTAHLASDWLLELIPAVAGTNIKLKQSPSLGAARQAHDLLVKQLKAKGDKRGMSTINDLRSRYEKKREKHGWSALKRTLDEAGVSPKLYRAIKSGKAAPELVLRRWSKVAKKGLNQAQLRAALLEG